MIKLSLIDTKVVNGGLTGLETTLYSTFGGCIVAGIAGAWVGRTAFAFGEIPGGLIGSITGAAAGMFIASTASAMNLNYGADTVVINSCMAGLVGLLSTSHVFSS